MSGTINWTIQGNVSNGSGNLQQQDALPTIQRSYTQSGEGVWRATVSVTTGGVTIAPSLTTPGYIMFVNLDPTNFIQLGGYPSSTLDSVCKLMPGDFAIWPFDTSATIRAKADTATCLLDVRAWNR